MTGALTPLTPREFAERALVGTLLWQPGRVIDIAAWLQPEDFRTPVNGVVFRHVRDAVAEACARVEWGTMPVHASDGSGLMPVTTDAQEALRTVMGIAENLRDMRSHAADWAEADVEGERHASADAAARYAAEYPGLLHQLDDLDRVEIDAVLPLAKFDAYAVPGVDPVALFDRISTSTELGDRTITAPFLHTLMATAPAAGVAQPEVYAQMVLEASLRRDVQRSGMQVAQISDVNAELAGLLAAVDAALNNVDAAHQRWLAATRNRGLTSTSGQPGIRSARSPQIHPGTVISTLDLIPAPDEREIAAAEETVLVAVLVRPDTLARLVDRLHPEDFADQQLGNTFRAATEVHSTSHTTGRRVDPVTVAWEQQRHEAQHGPGAPVERLMRLIDRGPVGDLEYAVDTMMRGRLVRLTTDAAQAVQHVAQHPGLQPSDVLHTARLAYEAVHATAKRMSGDTSTQTRFPEMHDPATGPVGAGPTSAQVIHLRHRSATLANNRPGEHTERTVEEVRARSHNLYREVFAGTTTETTGPAGAANSVSTAEFSAQEVHRDADLDL